MGVSTVLHPWYAVLSTASTLLTLQHSGCFALWGYLADDFPWPRGMKVGQTKPLPMEACSRSKSQLGHAIL